MPAPHQGQPGTVRGPRPAGSARREPRQRRSAAARSSGSPGRSARRHRSRRRPGPAHRRPALASVARGVDRHPGGAPGRGARPAARRTRRPGHRRSRHRDAPAIEPAAGRRLRAGPPRRGVPGRGPHRGTSSGSGPRPWCSGCHEPLHQALPAAGDGDLRRPSGGPAARGSRPGDHDGGRRTAASPRAACWRRRSTSTSRTRSRSAARG